MERSEDRRTPAEDDEETGAKRVSQSIILHFAAWQSLCQRVRGHSRIVKDNAHEDKGRTVRCALEIASYEASTSTGDADLLLEAEEQEE